MKELKCNISGYYYDDGIKTFLELLLNFLKIKPTFNNNLTIKSYER
jgi:hypothetical protein